MYTQHGFGQVQITFGGMSWAGAMASGVTSIQAIDPSFDGDEFLVFAQGAFTRVMEARASGRLDDVRLLLGEGVRQQFEATKGKAPRIASMEHATIYAAHRDTVWDSVTVRFAAKTTARKHNDFVEDWTFQRPAVTGQQQVPHECPSCGAPASLDHNGTCRYCRVSVSGARGGWKLVRAVPPPSAPEVSAGAKGWLLFWISFIVLMTVALPLGITVAVLSSTSNVVDNMAGRDSGLAGPSVSARSSERVSPSASIPAVTRPATYTGSGTFSGGITGNAGGTFVAAGGMAGSCTSRAGQVSGLVFTHDERDETQTRHLTVTMNLPAGARGPGDFDLATTDMNLTASFGGQPLTAGGKPEAQTWVRGPNTTARFHLDANAGGTLVVQDLRPSAPFPPSSSLSQPLSVTITFTCG